MKNIFAAFIVMGNVSFASAALLETVDIQGRLMIVDQEKGKISGIIENAEGRKKMKLTANINGKDMSCAGASKFIVESQLVSGYLDCGDGKTMSVILDLRNTEIIDYLQGGLASARMNVYMRDGDIGPAKSIFGGKVDIKKMN
ncbi:MAG: hypothetical protein WA160_04465 [Pseudobdellovibrio sp.]